MNDILAVLITIGVNRRYQIKNKNRKTTHDSTVEQNTFLHNTISMDCNDFRILYYSVLHENLKGP